MMKELTMSGVDNRTEGDTDGTKNILLRVIVVIPRVHRVFL